MIKLVKVVAWILFFIYWAGFVFEIVRLWRLIKHIDTSRDPDICSFCDVTIKNFPEFNSRLSFFSLDGITRHSAAKCLWGLFSFSIIAAISGLNSFFCFFAGMFAALFSFGFAVFEEKVFLLCHAALCHEQHTLRRDKM